MVSDLLSAFYRSKNRSESEPSNIVECGRCHSLGGMIICSYIHRFWCERPFKLNGLGCSEDIVYCTIPYCTMLIEVWFDLNLASIFSWILHKLF